MNSKDITYIITSARLGSFAEGARACSVSQPTLSAQIKKVESELGSKIFIRGSKGVKLTEFGSKILPQLIDVQNSIGNIHTMAKDSQFETVFNLDMGALFTIGPYLFPRIQNGIEKVNPNLKVNYIESTNDGLMQLLMAGHVDLAIISSPDRSVHCEECFINTLNPLINRKELFTENLYFALSKDNPFIDDTDFKKLKFHPEINFVLLHGESSISEKISQIFEDGSLVDPKKAIKTNNMESARTIVERSNNATLIPAIAKKDDDNLVYFPAPKSYSRKVELVTRRDNENKHLIDEVTDFIHGMYVS